MTIVLSLFLLLFTGRSFGAQYQLSDLEVLSSEGSYEEFFKHALDIRPSERQDAWKAMVSKMADIFTQNTLKKSEITASDFKSVENLYRWPSLKADDVYRLRRQDIGFKYLKKCLKQTDPCWSDVKSFWETDPTDSEMAIKLAEILKDYPNSPIPTWTFLDVALKSPLSEFYCKKPFVMDSLWDKIGIDYIRLGTMGDLTVKIDQTVHPDCLPSLIQTARLRLYSPKKENDRELSFQILKSQSKAGQGIEDFFYVIYLLEKPSQGELFNYSWNRLKELGNQSLRRERVLAEMKKLDPLPDTLFASMDESKKKVIGAHFKANFPEYFDFYSDQCVLFYGGKDSFPSGNPTIHCQELMNSELAPMLLPIDKIKRYQDVRKI